MRNLHKQILEIFDEKVINFFHEYYDEFSRVTLFILFFWFGILKVFLLSPASPLVTELLNKTFLSFLDPSLFLIFFGIFEMVLGVFVLIPKLERITFALMAFHLVTTVMPLFILADITWVMFLVPTLTGQYIIKNMALIALGMVLFARLRPMTETHSIIGEEVE